MTVLIIILFLLQLVGFAFVMVLFMKVAKFQMLEKEQKQLMHEMEQTMAAYLTEMKEENDRLIEAFKVSLKEERIKKQEVDVPIEKKSTSLPTAEQPTLNVQRVVPVQHAAKTYKAARNKQPVETTPVELSDREQAKEMRADGLSIEEIAKRLKKGKTEVELMLKFM